MEVSLVFEGETSDGTCVFFTEKVVVESVKMTRFLKGGKPLSFRGQDKKTPYSESKQREKGRRGDTL